MKKRLLSVILAAMLLAAMIPPAFALPFSDVTDSNMRKAVEMLNNLGVVSTAERFNPSGALTRAQFCALAVPLAGISDIGPYKTFTIFPDVRSNHWAMGYVNAAVRELKLFAPLPDGTFAPDRPITYYEAVTILVKMLGYEDKDVGYNWPRSYTAKAAAIGLTRGVSITETLNRGQGALLFYNLLYTPVKSADKDASESLFIETAFGSRRMADVVITGVNVYSRGKLGIWVEGGEFVPIRSDMDHSFIGCRADLLLDKSGHVLTAVRHDQRIDTVTVASAHERYIVDMHGREYDVALSTPMMLYGRMATYEDVSDQIGRNDTLLIAYTSNGDIDYITWEESDMERVGGVYVLDVNAVNGEGALCIKVDSGKEYYPSRLAMDSDLIGCLVNLTLNRRGEVIKVEPYEQTVSTLTVAAVTSAGVLATNGTSLLIPGDTSVIANGARTTYGSASMANTVKSGDTLRVFYKNNGALDYIAIIGSGNLGVSLVNICAYYLPQASDNNLLGFSLTPEAVLQAIRFRPGDRITLAISSTSVVHAVYAGHGLTATGVVLSDNSVSMYNGLVIDVATTSSLPVGSIVSVYGDISGKLIAQ